MDDGLNYLQTFNPAESKPGLLEHTLVGREALVDKLEREVEKLREQMDEMLKVDEEIMELLGSSAVTFQVVLTKCDKLRKPELDKIIR